jgi:acyl transferase domain-containing protein/thioesterase domain-containing protein/acyl carrier protein
MQNETSKNGAAFLAKSEEEPADRVYSDFDIAIIGLAGRFPGADSVEEYWENLCAGKESITFFSDEELEQSGISPETYNKPNYVKAAPILKEPGNFDAQFFGYSPREAAATDPQHRLFLECAWEALENAGYDVDRITKPVGVFGGSAMNTYLLNSGLLPQFNSDYLPTLIGNDNSFLTTRASYKFNLTGPSVTVQTACSTSLVAVHTGCQSLLNQECDMALAGGVAVRAPHRAGHLYQESSVFTPDGHCRAFDARAQGTIFGSGVGIVVLKRLEDAIKDQDTIHAIIKGSAINNDGSSKVDYTAPSVNSQSHVITEAIANADISADSISYIEAHGTGTNLGDPIEIAALTKAFRNHTDRKQFCAIGSVKTNIGHLDAAAGITGLIKIVMALKHKQIPASLHYETPNPQIDFGNSPFFVNTSLREWEPPSHPRRAGISSLGIGGTNAHVILEEAPNAKPTEKPSSNANSFQFGKRPELLLLSAKTEPALAQYKTKLANYLSKNPLVNLADVSHTLREGRKRFNHRSYIVCAGVDDAIAQINDPDSKQSYSGKAIDQAQEIVFMFPGQGAQYVRMGYDLYAHEAVFRAAVDRCSGILKPHLGCDIRDLLYPSSEEDEARNQSEITKTIYAQPAIFTIGYAMAQLLLSWGIRPAVVVGHSVGEFAAACVAGIFTLEDGLKLVAARGRLMQELPSGAMLAVRSSADAIEDLLTEDLSVAAINSTDRCVISGTPDAISDLQTQLEKQGLDYQALHTSHAFHSPMMDPIVDEFVQLAGSIQLAPSQIQFTSTVLGQVAQNEEYRSADYWGQNIRRTVYFADAATELLDVSNRIYIEVGPGTTLSTFIRQHPMRARHQLVLPSMRHPQDTTSDSTYLMGVLGRLWVGGQEIDWSKIYMDRYKRIPLPTYPFERKEHWYRPKTDSSPSPKDLTLITQKRLAFDKWFWAPSWKRTVIPHVMPKNDGTPWLIFSDDAGVASQIGQLLEKEKISFVTVLRGVKFCESGTRQFTINPSNADDYRHLLSRLEASHCYPTKIVHLWTIRDTCAFSNSEMINVDTGLVGLTALLYLTQAIESNTTFKKLKIQLSVLTNQLHSVTGEESLQPEGALVLAPCRVIGKEHSNIECASFDLALNSSENASDLRAQEMLSALLCDLAQTNYSEQVVAYRGKHRWVQTFESIDADSTKSLPISDFLVEDGVYLITGGLGGIGLALAEFLAKRVHARLVLINRTPLPERSSWDAWLHESQPEDAIYQKIVQLKHLEECGAKVLTLSADVTDETQMHATLRQVTESVGTIHGVIHAAGVVEDGLIVNKQMESVHRVLEAKVQGTLVLQKVLKDSGLSFFALCSSVNSILAPAGQIDYAAANAFLDHFAQYSTCATGINTISINWPGWRDAGMLARMEDSPWKQNALKEAISTSDAVKAFEKILAMQLPQIIVSPVRFKQDHIPVEEISIAQDGVKNEISSSVTTTKLPLSVMDEGTQTSSSNGNATTGISPTEKLVSEIWGECLGVDAISPGDNFFELGGSSLIAVQMFRRIKESTGKDFPISTLYQASTVRQLAVLLNDNVNENSRFESATDQHPTAVNAKNNVTNGSVETLQDADIGSNSISPAKLNSVIPIQTDGNKTPLFLMHGASGNVLMFRSLAKHLGPEQPVYGLESAGLTQGNSIHKSIEKMGIYYADGIMATQVEGPYIVGGYCMGGAIALEVAQILKQRGKEVSCVLLLDSFNVATVTKERPFFILCFHCLQLARYHWLYFWKLDQGKKLNYLRATASLIMAQARREALRMLKRGGLKQVALDEDKNSYMVWQANEHAGRSYVPDDYKGKVVLFKQYARFGYSRELGWEKVAVDGIDIEFLPAYPQMYLNEPYVASLANSVKKYLDKL